MYRRAIIASTKNLEAYDAACSWADSKGIDDRLVGTVFKGLATVVLFPGIDSDDQTREPPTTCY
jgi:hypothetical protein